MHRNGVDIHFTTLGFVFGENYSTISVGQQVQDGDPETLQLRTIINSDAPYNLSVFLCYPGIFKAVLIALLLYQHMHKFQCLRSEERRVGKECRSRWVS